MTDNSCLNCDCYDPDTGCTMPSVDKSYACTLEEDAHEMKHYTEKEPTCETCIEKSDCMLRLKQLGIPKPDYACSVYRPAQ